MQVKTVDMNDETSFGLQGLCQIALIASLIRMNRILIRMNRILIRMNRMVLEFIELRVFNYSIYSKTILFILIKFYSF
jgi:hypothetical protein